MVFNNRNSLNCAYCTKRQNKPDIITTTIFVPFFCLHKRTLSRQIQVKTGATLESKMSKSLLKDHIRHNKDNKGGFQVVRMFSSIHNSFKTTCSCILPLSVTDVMWGRELEVKCRWHIGLMQFLEYVMFFFPFLFTTTLPPLWVMYVC